MRGRRTGRVSLWSLHSREEERLIPVLRKETTYPWVLDFPEPPISNIPTYLTPARTESKKKPD